MLRFIIYFILFFIIYRLLRSLFIGMFKKKTFNQPQAKGSVKKSKYEDIEEAKYTEIDTKDEKEKLKSNGK